MLEREDLRIDQDSRQRALDPMGDFAGHLAQSRQALDLDSTLLVLAFLLLLRLLSIPRQDGHQRCEDAQKVKFQPELGILRPSEVRLPSGNKIEQGDHDSQDQALSKVSRQRNAE